MENRAPKLSQHAITEHSHKSLLGILTHPTFASLIIALVSCFIYANTLTNELLFDDLKLIPNNPLMHDPWNIGAILESRYWGGVLSSAHYRPLTVWTLALNYYLNEALGVAGEDVFGFHLFNGLFHAMVGCLLYWFFQQLRLTPAISFLAALLFATHPLHTEAVTFITGRAELLSAIFGLLFLLFHRWNRWA